MLFTRSYLGFELSWFQVIFTYPFWPFRVAITWNILQLAPLYIVSIYGLMKFLMSLCTSREKPLSTRLRDLFAPEIIIYEPDIPSFFLDPSGQHFRLPLQHSNHHHHHHGHPVHGHYHHHCTEAPPDPPPKYSPPPSYSSATAKPLMKQFRSRFSSNITIDIPFLNSNHNNNNNQDSIATESTVNSNEQSDLQAKCSTTTVNKQLRSKLSSKS